MEIMELLYLAYQMKIKQELYNQCQLFVNQRLFTVQHILASNTEGLNNETKSSAGDKHETGRAMLQLEMEKASQQLEGIQEMIAVLQRIDLTKSPVTACLGSVVHTNEGSYFLSISAGRLQVESNSYFAVSTASPIGKILLGKQRDDRVLFNGKHIHITAIL